MFIKFLIVCSIVFLIYDIKLNFLSQDFFKIKKINVLKNYKMLDYELTNILKKIYNKNKYKIDFKVLEDFLSKDIRIKNINITNKSVDELEINIEECKLEYYCIINNKIYLVDANGSVFGYFNEEKREPVPIIIANDKNEMMKAVGTLSLIKDINLYTLISQIFISKDNFINIVLYDGTTIKCDENTTKDKFDVVEILYSSISKDKKVEYIDLRFDNYIVKFIGEVYE